MHIIIGLLGSIVTILWLLHRLADMGIDLGGLNPWLWRRRRNWKKRYEANPVFGVENPMDATALLMAAVAKADGEISSEEKQAMLNMFEQEFHLSNKDASALLRSSTFILGSGEEVLSNVKQVLAPSLDEFSAEQAASAVSMIDRIYQLSPAPGSDREKLATEASALLTPNESPKSTWD